MKKSDSGQALLLGLLGLGIGLAVWATTSAKKKDDDDDGGGGGGELRLTGLPSIIINLEEE